MKTNPEHKGDKMATQSPKRNDSSMSLKEQYDNLERSMGSEVVEKARDLIPELDDILQEELSGGELSGYSNPIEHFMEVKESGTTGYDNELAKKYHNVATRILKRYQDVELYVDADVEMDAEIDVELEEFDDQKIYYRELVETRREAYCENLKEWHKYFRRALDATDESQKDTKFDFNSSGKTEEFDQYLKDIGIEEHIDLGDKTLTEFRKAVYEALENGKSTNRSTLEFFKASEIAVIEGNDTIPDSQKEEVEIRYKVIDHFKSMLDNNKKTDVLEDSSW